MKLAFVSFWSCFIQAGDEQYHCIFLECTLPLPSAEVCIRDKKPTFSCWMFVAMSYMIYLTLFCRVYCTNWDIVIYYYQNYQELVIEKYGKVKGHDKQVLIFSSFSLIKCLLGNIYWTNP